MIVRGGLPQCRNESVDTTGRQFAFHQGTTHITIRNSGADDILVSFSQEEFDGGIGITVPTGAVIGNPFQLDAELIQRSIWVKAKASASTFEAVALLRPGG